MAISAKGSNSSSNRGRAYGMLLLLAFCAAVLGIMVLHKLRERRIFNLLIKEKDRDLMALHLLLQKERDSNREVKGKIEELKAKTYSLRSQKIELSRRIVEMQSVTASLKEEQIALESALEEKQNEIKILKKNEVDSSKENSQIMALKEHLKQKEIEFEALKHNSENPEKVLSVSTDDPSNPHVSLTETGNIIGKLKNEAGENKEGETSNEKQLEGSENPAKHQISKMRRQDGNGNNIDQSKNEMGESQEGGIFDDKQLQGSENPREDESSSVRSEDGNRNGTEFADQIEVPRELQLQNLGSSQEGEAFGKRISAGENSADEGQLEGVVLGNEKTVKLEDSQDNSSFEVRDKKNKRYETEMLLENSRGNQVLKINDGGPDGKEFKATKEGQRRLRSKNSQDGESRELGIISRGGVKLENGVAYEHGLRSRRGARHRITSKDRELEKTRISHNNGGISIRGRRFYRGALEKTGNTQGKKTGLRMRDKLGRRDSTVGHGNKGEGKLEVHEVSTNSVGNKNLELEGKRRGAMENAEKHEIPDYSGRSEDSRARDEKGDQSPTEASKEGASSDGQQQKPENTEDAENLRIRNSGSNEQEGKENEMVSTGGQSGKPQESQHKERMTTKKVDKNGSEDAANAMERRLDEIVSWSGHQEASSVQEPEDRGHTNNINTNSTEETRDGNGEEEMEDFEGGTIREAGKHEDGSLVSNEYNLL